MPDSRPPLSSFMTQKGSSRPPLSSFMKSDLKSKKDDNSSLDFKGAKTGVGKLFQGAQNMFKDFGVGIGTSIGKAGLGLGEFASKAISIGSALDPGGNSEFFGKKVPEKLENLKKGIFEDPYKKELNTFSGKSGEVVGDIAQFAEGGKPITEAQKILEPLAAKIPTKIGSFLGKKAAQILPEVAGTGAMEYVKTGGDAEKAKNAAIGAGLFSSLTHIGSDAVKSIIPQSIKENFSRVLGYTGKTSLGETSGKKIDDAVSAFTTLNNMASDIKVIDKDGIEKIFDPVKSDFTELPQALSQAKDKIYNSYTELANKAGDEGANFGQSDFNSVIKILDKYSERGYTKAFSNKAAEIKEALQRFGTYNEKDGQYYFKNTSPEDIQTLIQNINKDVNPLSDRAGSDVSQETSKALRDIMDKKITESTGNPDYQKLRTAYSQLKSIEKDVLNNWKKAMRKSGVKPGLIDGIATLDTLKGILTNNPLETAKGLGISSIKKAFQYLRDPEVNMRRAFQMLQDEAKGTKPSVTTSRLFGN